MLKQLPEYKDAEIVRSRDPAVLSAQTIVVDVGGVYDPATHRYDHHQRGFTETLSPAHKTKLSSAGLVYKHFGRQVIETITSATGDDLELIYQKVYTNFVEGVDGIDNGISQYPAELEPAYQVKTDLSSRVGRLNPSWNEQGVDRDAQFQKAVAMTGEDFLAFVNFYAKSFIPAREIVAKSLAGRFDVHESGQIMHLKDYTIWAKHLHELEREQKSEKLVLYVIYQDTSGQFRVQAVAEKEGSFVSRKALPEPWRGVRDEALSELSGIPDCVFVHAAGFIGGNKTLQGALAMATRALTM